MPWSTWTTKSPGFEFREIAEEARGADFAAGAVQRRRDLEEVGIAEQREFRVWERHAFGERRADQQQRGGFMGALRGESRRGVFGFAQDVGRFVFAADVREALQLAGAGGGQQNLAAIGELRFHIAHAGDDVAVKA